MTPCNVVDCCRRQVHLQVEPEGFMGTPVTIYHARQRHFRESSNLQAFISPGKYQESILKQAMTPLNPNVFTVHDR
jgi:hypothetical protein